MFGLACLEDCDQKEENLNSWECPYDSACMHGVGRSDILCTKLNDFLSFMLSCDVGLEQILKKEQNDNEF